MDASIFGKGGRKILKNSPKVWCFRFTNKNNLVGTCDIKKAGLQKGSIVNFNLSAQHISNKCYSAYPRNVTAYHRNVTAFARGDNVFADIPKCTVQS